MKYLIDSESESSNMASQEELKNSSGNINLNYSRYTHLSTTKETLDIIITDTIKT